MTAKINAPLPDAGGSYTRDPKTGALQPTGKPPEIPEPETGKPLAKPAKQPVKEA